MKKSGALWIATVALCLPAAAGEDSETTRIPFQATTSFKFHGAPAGVGLSPTQDTVIGKVPGNTRLVITQFSARCDTAESTANVGPLALSVSAPVFFQTADEAQVTHWFPVVAQGRGAFEHCVPAYREDCWVPVKLWAASSPTHVYAGAGTEVTVAGTIGGYAPIQFTYGVIDSEPTCHVTISGYLVIPGVPTP